MKKNTILGILCFLGTFFPSLFLAFFRRVLDVYISIPQQNIYLIFGLIVDIIGIVYYVFFFHKGERNKTSHILMVLCILGILSTASTFVFIAAANEAMNSFF
jgi:drug/metabolite transporter (DMT)-like permease